jgi:predicted DNA-binding WGR domain protein
VSDWDVQLVFTEGSSNKFWRARTDGGRMFVNYGRIGTNGQTQVKDFPTPEKAKAEMEKVAGSKRRKGYWDEEGDPAAGEAAPAAPAAPPAKEAPKPAAKAVASVQLADMELSEGKRKIELRLVQDGSQLRTVVVEHYDSPKRAAEAFERIARAMAEEGYQKVPMRKDL